MLTKSLTRPNRSLTATVLAVAIAVAIAVTVAATPSHGCVGRKLVLGSVDDDRSAMVMRVLSILIHERTGTTVEVKYFRDRGKLLGSVKKGKVDLYVDAVDDALRRMGEDGSSFSPGERFSMIKRRFDEEKNLIWLKPMGYTEKDSRGNPLGRAAVVVGKDTLKMFPAPPRLLEKIGTRIVLDDKLLDTLVGRGQAEKPSKVARNFLKEVKLI